MSNEVNIKDLCPNNFDELLFDILDHKHTHYFLKGGRGSTKSTFIGWVIPLLLTQTPNAHAVVFRKTANTLRDSVFTQIQAGISMLHLEEYFECTVSPMKITYKPTKQTVVFRGVDDKFKIKSLKAPFGYFAIAWFEECDTFAGMDEIRSVLQSTMRGGQKYWTFYSFNPPQTINNFMNQEVLVDRDDKVVHHSTYLSVPKEWLGEQFFNEAEHVKQINERAYRHEYLGEANGTGGNVFENVEIREITNEEISQFDRIYFGVDWGFYPDYYAFVKCHYDSARLTLYIFDEYTCNKKGNRETYEELVNNHGVTGNDLIICDSAEPKSIGDYKAYGLLARGAEKGPGSIDYSMKWLQSLKAIVIDNRRCPVAVEEFLNYEYERDKEGNVISGYPDKDNHCIDATRYACNSIWRKKGQ